MNKLELIDSFADSADISEAAAGRALDAAIEAVIKALRKGDTVRLVGFGTFYVGKRAARNGRNPRTGTTIKIDQDQSCENSEISRWQRIKRCIKLASFAGA